MDLKALLGQMTLEEKIGQLIQLSADFFGESTELTGPAQSWGLSIEELSSIGTCIGGKNAAEIRKIQEEHLKIDRNKIPLIFMRDIIHGYRTVYPIGLGLVGSFDPELVGECTEMAAKEAAAGGLHLTFAPMVDLVRDARWGRVMESCGEDPLLASTMGAAQVKAFQGEDISSRDHLAACVKHFAAYGAGESGRDYNSVEISERTLRQFYLPSYKACIDAGVKMLMPSFNDMNGIPSTANPFLMKRILRDEWHYDGAVISDWAAIWELTVHGVAADMKEAARLAFENGCHIEMLSSAYYKHLAELVREGVITEEAVDDAVMHVLRLKDELGLFDDPFHQADDARGEAMYLSPEHREVARRASEESAVLLKNDGTLPFSEDVKKVAIVGPFADEQAMIGPWSALGKTEEAVSVTSGVRALLPNAEISVHKACGYLFDELDKSGFADAIEAAKNADAVIICVGEPAHYSGEGNSRTDIGLPGVQADLVNEITAVNKNSAVLIFNGRPLALSNIYKNAPAILDMWFPGSEGGNAAAALLFGRANPCGKLAMTFPRAVGQCPIYYNRMLTGRPKKGPEEVYKPFTSGYLDCGNLPLFFFGEGLSYTTFEYNAMTLDTHELDEKGSIKVTVSLTNTGERAGKEVVQLYLRDKASSAVRPIQELIAFKKITLEANESAEVCFEITEPMLRFWNAQNEYISEAGEFELFVGYADHRYISDEFTLVK
ncbi:MAG: beta-glucosidase [Ruminococcaceae bacterium]|nr:beta-glucosidase [Oscillospiraceae bacterium]